MENSTFICLALYLAVILSSASSARCHPKLSDMSDMSGPGVSDHSTAEGMTPSSVSNDVVVMKSAAELSEPLPDELFYIHHSTPSNGAVNIPYSPSKDFVVTSDGEKLEIKAIDRKPEPKRKGVSLLWYAVLNPRGEIEFISSTMRTVRRMFMKQRCEIVFTLYFSTSAFTRSRRWLKDILTTKDKDASNRISYTVHQKRTVELEYYKAIEQDIALTTKFQLGFAGKSQHYFLELQDGKPTISLRQISHVNVDCVYCLAYDAKSGIYKKSSSERCIIPLYVEVLALETYMESTEVKGTILLRGTKDYYL